VQHLLYPSSAVLLFPRSRREYLSQEKTRPDSLRLGFSKPSWSLPQGVEEETLPLREEFSLRGVSSWRGISRRRYL
jgi:hypothetical protein